MARSAGLQRWIEDKAEGPAYFTVALCMISRAAAFYSGTETILKQLLGEAGMRIYSIFTGVGLAAGSALLMAVSGRQWRFHLAEAAEAKARKGLSKTERAALVASFEDKARLHLLFMLVGMGAEFAAALSFLWTELADHSFFTVFGDVLISVLLVLISLYFGVFKEHRGETAEEIADEHALTIRSGVVEEAGRRIASGTYSPQDVRIVANSIRDRIARDRFMAALHPNTSGDPQWTTSDLMHWLGDETDAMRRRLQRRLAKLQEKGHAIWRDENGAWTFPRSLALEHFAADFLEAHAPGPIRDVASQVRTRRASQPRQKAVENAGAAQIDGDVDTTATRRRQTGDSPEGEEAEQIPSLALASGPISPSPVSLV